MLSLIRNLAVAAVVLPALALTALALPALAGTLEPGDEPIPLQEWREMTEGRVVWYTLRGQHWGREYFHRGQDLATFILYDGTCITAPWGYADGVFCFSYAGTDCFRHVRRAGEIVVIPIGAGEAQSVERISDDGPLSCEPPLAM